MRLASDHSRRFRTVPGGEKDMKNKVIHLASAAALAFVGMAAVAQTPNGPTDADLMASATNTKAVLTYGMGPKGQRFSPLEQINTETVARLVPAFAASLGGEKQRGQESQPIVYDGMIYVTGSYSRLYAFDARTGEE